MEATHSTPAEEIIHSVTHGLGAILGIIGMLILVAVAANYGNTAVWTSVVFSLSAILLYGASAVYHGIPAHLPELKAACRRADHSAIYLLIAGTYTPFAVITVQGKLGWGLFIAVWSIALMGVTWKLFGQKERARLSLTIYLVMGWVGVLAAKTVFDSLAAGGLWLLAGGGLAYSFGAIFYAWNKLPYNHAIWHMFVLLGTALHYFAILYYVVPMAT